MVRRRLGFALTILAGFAASAHAAPLHVPQAEVMQRLAPALATHDPARLTMAFRAMGDYGHPAAEIVEAMVNNSGYRLLDSDDVAAAIAVFELNVESFPDSSNAWDSLAEAVNANGDHAMAIRFYSRSLELDPENHNAGNKLRQLENTPQLSQAGASSR